MPKLNNKASTIALAVLGLATLAVGLFMLGGGIYLIILGGSWYFALAGLALSMVAVPIP
jgi:quinate dehydrogenase (quinone)